MNNHELQEQYFVFLLTWINKWCKCMLCIN